MRIEEMNWGQVEARIQQDDRCVLPLGCTEQHAYLSLATDTILASRVSVEAAAPMGVPVFPALPYGLTASFMAYPGTVTFTLETYGWILRELMSSIYKQGFRRILIVNGHGGNTPARASIIDWLDAHPDAKVKWYDWWNAPATWDKVQSIDPMASHASWSENFPWTRLPGIDSPGEQKPMVPMADIRALDPRTVREKLGDGSFGGFYTRSDEEVLAIWEVAVQETRLELERF